MDIIFALILYVVSFGLFRLFITKVVDLILGILFLGGGVLLAIAISQENLSPLYGIAGGIFISLISMPLWPFSSIGINTRSYLKMFIKKCNGNFFELATKNDTLEKNIQCPNCLKKLELDEIERNEKKITCPECNTLIDLS